MAPPHDDPSSSGEEDAPEGISFAQSKRNVKKGDSALQKAHAAEKQKNKLRNKERDRRLKEQAVNSKRKRKEGLQESDADLQARMERAMQDAENEVDSDGDSEGDVFDGIEEDEFKGIDSGFDEDSGEGSGSESSQGSPHDDEDMDFEQTETPRINPNYLPDSLFTSAFASTTTKSVSKRKATDDNIPGTRGKSRKRTRSNHQPKDVLLGTRTIRTLASGATVAGASTLPSSKVKKFLDRSLGLKGPSAKKRGWERRPVNLGVMRRDGPATSFVRNR
ncbi:hypothetical protein H0H92_011793 [Tricholoma furcatifolium]|nr:hypothetical protein H0H92_011793 [Tricholoma furcatifolium]